MTEEEIKDFLNRMEEKENNEPVVKKVSFPSLESPQGPEQIKIGVSYLEAIPVDITAQLGQATLKIKEILGLKEGSVVELERLVGDTIDVLVNRQIFARGEVVVIGSNFGIRIDSICDPEKPGCPK